ncbi:MAG: anaerobic ribonucleoside-triphosphate reductase activating protein [Oscillospiraceae bacterium]|nr:anaerobic ribonucleoside-triphosphate reductase activating protein [Oscillospiraceae bacterium]
MKLSGMQKLTLLDFPGKMACTLFTPGCNFLCPFCHNSSLVTDIDEHFIKAEEVLRFLSTRQGILEGVCITGGEPLLQKDIEDFMREIKDMDFLVKLDTNGSFPHKLEGIIEEGLVDYVAMDVKNSPELYAETIGKTALDLSSVNESLELLKEGRVPYEFRTTVTKNFHNLKSLLEIADWISGCDSYYLQQFVNSGQLIDETITGYTDEELKALYREVKRKLPCTQLRGV